MALRRIKAIAFLLINAKIKSLKSIVEPAELVGRASTDVHRCVGLVPGWSFLSWKYKREHRFVSLLRDVTSDLNEEVRCPDQRERSRCV